MTPLQKYAAKRHFLTKLRVRMFGPSRRSRRNKGLRNVALGTAGVIGASLLAKRFGLFGRRAAKAAKANPYSGDVNRVLDSHLSDFKNYHLGIDRHRLGGNKQQLKSLMQEHGFSDEVFAAPAFDLRGAEGTAGSRAYRDLDFLSAIEKNMAAKGYTLPEGRQWSEALIGHQQSVHMDNMAREFSRKAWGRLLGTA
jgi:hypothetical protein